MRIMALKTRNKAPTVRIQAAPVLAMAFFEQKGLTELIDSRFDLDKRIKLTPGNAVKAMVGQMMSTERRRALFGLNDFYVQAPTERLFGKKRGPEGFGSYCIQQEPGPPFQEGARRAYF